MCDLVFVGVGVREKEHFSSEKLKFCIKRRFFLPLELNNIGLRRNETAILELIARPRIYGFRRTHTGPSAREGTAFKKGRTTQHLRRGKKNISHQFPIFYLCLRICGEQVWGGKSRWLNSKSANNCAHCSRCDLSQ